MPDTRDYLLAQVLDTGDLVHHARPTGLFGRHLETRCGLEGQRTGRDGGARCPECVALEQAEVDTNDKSGESEVAAEVTGLLRSLPRTKITPENITQHMIDRWYREKSEYLDEIRDLHKQLAAATARAESATVLPERWRALIAERDAANERAEKAEALVAKLRTDRDHCVAREITAKIEARQLRREITELRNADYGDGWSSRRPDASLDGLRGPFTGLLGPLGVGVDAAPDGQAEDVVLPVADCPSPYRDGTCRHLTCGRCNEHTNNSSQGHYWAYCKVTKTKREHHFCCPGDCELEPPNIRHDDTNGAEQ